VAIAIAGAIPERLQQALAQWRQWDCPVPLKKAPDIVGPIGRGRSNASFLVAAGQQFVVRIDGIQPWAHGINRQAEWRVLGLAHQRGIAPRPCYFNPELGALVCAYLAPDEPAPDSAEATAMLLRRIHTLPRMHQRLHLGERLQRYQRGLDNDRGERSARLARLAPAIHRLLEVIAGDASAPVLCHNDLLRANRLYSGGKLYAIDWEYAAMASPLYDLAVVMHADEFDEPDAQRLARCYLGRAPGTDEAALLLSYGCLYRYLELLWYRAMQEPASRAHSGGAGDTAPPEESRHLDTRLAALEALLANALP
tara:strand:- start:5844 stop:6773 length:930 start_codon:yes stop_codon:yes gene_type:complete